MGNGRQYHHTLKNQGKNTSTKLPDDQWVMADSTTTHTHTHTKIKGKILHLIYLMSNGQRSTVPPVQHPVHIDNTAGWLWLSFHQSKTKRDPGLCRINTQGSIISP